MPFQSNFKPPRLPDRRHDLPRGMRFDLINARDMALIIAIAERMKNVTLDWRRRFPADNVAEPNPTVTQVDVAVVHLTRGLDLLRFLQANEFEFMAEHVTIQKNIVRPLHQFPEDVNLRFASTSARVFNNPATH